MENEKPEFTHRVFIHTANKIFLEGFPYFDEYQDKMNALLKKNKKQMDRNPERLNPNFFEGLIKLSRELAAKIRNTDYFESKERCQIYADHLILNLAILCTLESYESIRCDADTMIQYLIIKYLYFYDWIPRNLGDSVYHLWYLGRKEAFQQYYLALKWFLKKELTKTYSASAGAHIRWELKKYEDEILSKEPDKAWKRKYIFNRWR